MGTDKAAEPEVALLPFEPERDLPRLAEWLGRPHVARWFGDPDSDLDFAGDVPEGADHALIACEGEPIGYLRWQSVSRVVLDAVGLPEVPVGAVDVDLFLGEAAHLGRGIGRRALALLLDHLRQDPSVPLAGLTTSVDNGPAIRAFEKAGFRKLRQYEAPGGLCWLLVAELGGE